MWGTLPWRCGWIPIWKGYDGVRKPINRAYVTLVAMDENDRPTKVPGLILETEAERAEWEAGEKRRQMRKQREREGF